MYGGHPLLNFGGELRKQQTEKMKLTHLTVHANHGACKLLYMNQMFATSLNGCLCTQKVVALCQFDCKKHLFEITAPI